MLHRLWKKKQGGPAKKHHVLTRGELDANARKRLSTINSEFRHTFKFLQSYPNSVTFFGSARFPEDNQYYQRARELAKKIVKETGYTVVTGGGPGIMEAANRGAYEAGGKSVGMNIVLPHEQKINEYLTAHVRFYYFFIRKVALSFSAEVYVFFPGGYGTLDEFFEIVTLMQTKKIPPTPIVCVGREFWSHIKGLSKHLLDDFEAISPGDEDLFRIVDSDEEVIEIIKKTPQKRV